jgi:hypothetical protein
MVPRTTLALHGMAREARYTVELLVVIRMLPPSLPAPLLLRVDAALELVAVKVIRATTVGTA